MILKANISILKSKQLLLFVFAGQYYPYFELFTELYLTTVFALAPLLHNVTPSSVTMSNQGAFLAINKIVGQSDIYQA